ncbi:MAG: YeeE/YedE thiosulfate transporter family protein [Clostridiales bacterium]|nr:YeeE/YedE thiosulfate transporter family protein [Clostridiales bacterium]
MNYGSSFLSGFLLLYGARMAGGCTSGHMMSGMMQSSVSGFVFAAVVFVVAIPTAILVGNRRRKEHS